MTPGVAEVAARSNAPPISEVLSVTRGTLADSERVLNEVLDRLRGGSTDLPRDRAIHGGPIQTNDSVVTVTHEVNTLAGRIQILATELLRAI